MRSYEEKIRWSDDTETAGRTNRNTQFSNREWILIIVIVICILYICLIHHRSISAQNYVSFTGTIVSIIVGVLAIVYAMLESVRQSASNQKMQSGADAIEVASRNLDETVLQITELTNVTKKIQQELESASYRNTQKLDQAFENFDGKLSNLELIKSKVESISADVDSIRQGYEYDAKNENVQKESTKVDADSSIQTEAISIIDLIRNLAFGVLSNPIPFALVVLSTFQNKLFVDFQKTTQYRSLTESLDGNFFINLDGVFMSMGVVHNVLTEAKVIRRSDDRWHIDEKYNVYVLTVCRDLADHAVELFSNDEDGEEENNQRVEVKVLRSVCQAIEYRISKNESVSNTPVSD